MIGELEAEGKVALVCEVLNSSVEHIEFSENERIYTYI